MKPATADSAEQDGVIDLEFDDTVQKLFLLFQEMVKL